MKTWRVGVAVILFTLCLTAGLVFGNDPPLPNPERGHQDPAFFGGPMGPSGFGFDPTFRLGFEQQLNLSKEQLDEIKKMRDLSHKKTRDLRYKLAKKHLEMRKLISDPKVNEATLLAKQKEISALSEKLHNKIAYTMIKVRKILSPEQISKLDQIPPPPIPHRMDKKGRDMMEEPYSRRDGGPDLDDGGDRPFGPRPQ